MDSNKIQLTKLRVAILGATPLFSDKGGAERLYEGIKNGFVELGFLVDLIIIPADEITFNNILKNYQYCRELDLTDYDMVVSTKVPTYAVHHKNHVLFLVHTIRVFDDLFPGAFDDLNQKQFKHRAIIHQLDFEAIQGIKSVYSMAHEVKNRLYRWIGVNSEVIHPPLGFDNFKSGQTGDYFFLPGRLHKWKRVDLVIRAIKLSSLPLKLIIAGAGEAENSLKDLADGDPKITFLGKISDSELIEYYANCLAVPFVPSHEDYGYITLEAFASEKPVITCRDSGEPIYFVQNYHTGLVVDSTPEDLCRALEWFYLNKYEAAKMGKNGKKFIVGMSWKRVAERLAFAAMSSNKEIKIHKIKVLVLDMQPIMPAVGGGRLRLLGLYHGLGSFIECKYVGTYDWPGEKYREHNVSDTLCEIDIPLSNAHFKAASDLASAAGGVNLIDLAFSSQAHLSPEYIARVKKELQDSDVVIFSHPWIYPLVKDYLKENQVIIYDSHNVEGYLRAQVLDLKYEAQAQILEKVVSDEYELVCRADWVLACSHEDLLKFFKLYKAAPEKLRIVPNGVMAFNGQVSSDKYRKVAREKLDLDQNKLIGIFIGSQYGPNLDAAKFIVERLAPELQEVIFVIAGGVGEKLQSNLPNVVLTGFIDDQQKYLWLQSANFALNPMMRGSGTNIKMFDYMAMSLPVITTSIGARGIETAGTKAFIKVEANTQSFLNAIREIKSKDLKNQIGRQARLIAEEGYSWERISKQLGLFIQNKVKTAGQHRPLFSVVVPSYERHKQLDSLFIRLQNQIERDFEVIVVDQSQEEWSNVNKLYGFPLTYYKSPVKGAVRARNNGGFLAQGQVIAFIDDDCLPDDEWLLNARPYFNEENNVGLEGLIYSDKLNDLNWRPVSNIDFEGIGFMTANLMIRSGIFQYLGGFDLNFDKPHFREDTDLGWRMQELGEVPYASEVRVFHPAQERAIERESSHERDKYFCKDALLYKKHPEKYKEIFFKEGNYKKGKSFFDNVLKGFLDLNISMPEWMKQYYDEYGRQ